MEDKPLDVETKCLHGEVKFLGEQKGRKARTDTLGV
jgi:hypothetical protein